MAEGLRSRSNSINSGRRNLEVEVEVEVGLSLTRISRIVTRLSSPRRSLTDQHLPSVSLPPPHPLPAPLHPALPPTRTGARPPDGVDVGGGGSRVGGGSLVRWVFFLPCVFFPALRTIRYHFSLRHRSLFEIRTLLLLCPLDARRLVSRHWPSTKPGDGDLSQASHVGACFL